MNTKKILSIFFPFICMITNQKRRKSNFHCSFPIQKFHRHLTFARSRNHSHCPGKSFLRNLSAHYWSHVLEYFLWFSIFNIRKPSCFWFVAIATFLSHSLFERLDQIACFCTTIQNLISMFLIRYFHFHPSYFLPCHISPQTKCFKLKSYLFPA
jgi:hypothetical protein